MQARNSTPDRDDIGKVQVFSRDLTDDALAKLTESRRVAWDIETDGLDPTVSRIGTCQLYSPTAGAFVVKDLAGEYPERLGCLLADRDIVKVFHHAPFDISFMLYAWHVTPANIRCTKIAAKLLSPTASADHFSLKYLMWHHFGIELDKGARFTDWTTSSLTDRQLSYAVGDVIRLLDLYDLLSMKLSERDFMDLYERACDFLPVHARLRLHGCPDPYSY